LVATQARIDVSPTSGLITTEDGGTAQFTAVLALQPTVDVTIGLHSSDTSRGTVSTSKLTFTPTDWDVPQTVTITGVGDGIIGQDETYTIITDPAVSTDPNFDGVNPSDVTVTNLERDLRDLQVVDLQT